MSEVIEARNIKLNVEASDWRDSMIKSGQLLVDSEYITKDYIDLTIKCVEENGPYIVIIPGLALSHSRPDVSVKKTGLSLITLSKPVCFDCDNDPVDIVLTLAATDDTFHLEKLQSMAEFISDEDNIEFIKNARTTEEVAKAINEFEPEEYEGRIEDGNIKHSIYVCIEQYFDESGVLRRTDRLSWIYLIRKKMV